MSTSDTDPAVALRRVADALAKLSNDDIVRLCDRAYDVEIKVVRRRTKDAPVLADAVTSTTRILELLAIAATREEADVVLVESIRSRKQLEAVARSLDMPIAKTDKVEVLRKKIVESTVGARIRSHTIRGTDNQPS